MMTNDEIELLQDLLKKAEEAVSRQFNKIFAWENANHVRGLRGHVPLWGRYEFYGVRISNGKIVAIIQSSENEELFEECPIDTAYADGIIAEATKEREIILQRIKYEVEQKLQSDRALYEKLKAQFGGEEA